ncbi:DUF4249 domain-containing protein [Prolixibacteraceae bacterium JC049]|nr:DUF4249 domain-containing protein [Prolixibacteraceae bacterium JC049]
MYKKIFIFTLLASSLFSACRKTIEFEPENNEDFIILFSELNPDSTFRAKLSRAKSIVVYENQKLINPKVEIYADGQLLEQLTYNATREIWLGTQKPEINKEYEVRAYADGLKTVSGTTTILPPVKYTLLTPTTLTPKAYIEWEMTIKDNGEEENYFQLNPYLYTKYEEKTATTTTYSETISRYLKRVKSEDPVLSHNSTEKEFLDDSPENDYLILSDELFNGKTYTLKYSFSLPYHLSQPEKVPGLIKYTVNTELRHISRELYLYYKTINIQDFYYENPFTEPVQIFSNVKNGAGVVGSYSSYNTSITLFDKK